MKPFVFSLVLLTLAPLSFAADRPPNIVYIMSDELAYFELGHMGNPYIRTPRIDAMAKEGLRFTNALAAAPVCAPLRGSLMTGKHQGHCSVRANDGGTALRAEDVTIATVLKNQKGYATGGYGKWGAGGRDSTGVPEKHGFDDFFGYYDQVHAHSFYPPYLVRNSEEVVLEGNIGGRSGETYAHYPIIEAGLEFIRKNKDKPFFAYFPITPPHGMYDIPADDPAWELYEDAEWMKDPTLNQDIKNYAAMVSMVDHNLGQIIDLLKELGLEENTIVFFTGDNGGQDRFRSKEHPRGFFMPNKDPKTGIEFRGGKGNLYEGGLKIPFLVRWPGKIEAGRTSDLIFNQVDIFRTLADLTGARAPDDVDGMSILPEILGDSEDQPQHEMLYWEYGSMTAVRYGKWKAVETEKHNERKARWALYDLEKGISETTDIAADHPEILEKMKTYAAGEHEEWIKGTYSDPERKRHERDRWAKYGTSRPQASNQPKGKMHKITGKNLVPADGMKLVSFSSENHGNDRKAIYAIDGKAGTVWHSRFSEKVAEHPHELVIDLGKRHAIEGFRYLVRQDQGWNGAFAKTEFFVGDNAEAFPEKPAAEATFGKVREAQAADCRQPVTGRFVKVRNLSEVNGNNWASAAEIGIVGTPADQ